MNPRLYKVLNELRNNSRRSLTGIGAATEMPLSTVFKAVNKLENDIVTKHIAIPDFSKLGYPLKTGFLIKCGDMERLKSFLLKYPNLNTLLRLSGEYNFYAELLFKNIMGYQDFMDGLKAAGDVKRVSSHFLTDVKQEAFKVGEMML